MKFRKDFVTNSSSSSYICEICGRTESGWDMGLSEAEMVCCVNGHTFCSDERLPISKEELIKQILSYEEDCDEDGKHSADELVNMEVDDLDEIFLYLDDMRWEIPEEFCPICQFIEYSEYDLSRYLERVYGVNRDEVFNKVKEINKRRKKLYENEYITEVCTRFNLNPSEVVASWKERFGTYADFKKYLRGY